MRSRLARVSAMVSASQDDVLEMAAAAAALVTLDTTKGPRPLSTSRIIGALPTP